MKSVEEHRGLAPRPQQEEKEEEQSGLEHRQLAGQDSLTELQAGSGRYQTVVVGSSPHCSRQVGRWNDTALGCNSVTSSAGEMTTPLPGVIERLDSLVLGTSPLTSLDSGNPAAAADSGPESPPGPGGPGGILKEAGRERARSKRGITFPDYEELQEIIGYGGDMYYSSEEEEAAEPERKSDNDYSEELTQEERNVLNITKKNTSFNSHPQNLKDPTGSPVPKLGVDKKHTPVISVRPFVREHTPGKVNMVSPMINGELVTPKSQQNSIKKLEKDEGGGRGEMKSNKQDSLGSDGSTENSSSDSDTRDSPPPTSPLPGPFTKQTSFLATQIEEQKAKSSAAAARLSFLNSYSVQPRVKQAGETLVAGLRSGTGAKLSLPSSQTGLQSGGEEEWVADRETGEEEEEAEREERGAKRVNTAARLSFLNSTITHSTAAAAPGQFSPTKLESESDAAPAPPPVSRQVSPDCEDKAKPAQDDGNPADKSQVPKNGPEKVTSNRSDSCKDSSLNKVKLTRKSPYVVGPYASTAILKGTPKPMITRKPPILKDKPKVPLKPNKLLMRSPSPSSSSRSPSPTTAVPPAPPTAASTSPVAAPRKSSFRQPNEYMNLSPAAGTETKLEDSSSITVSGSGRKDSETIAGSAERNNSLVISVSAEATAESVQLREQSPPQVQKNLANKNKEALEAIRKSLSNKLISLAPPALVQESIAASEGRASRQTGPSGCPGNTTSAFEDARASIADALQFSRGEAGRPSKRVAPSPPAALQQAEQAAADETFDNCQNESSADPSSEIIAEEVSNDLEVSAEPKLTPAIRASSMKSSDGGGKPLRTVQFSPETVTVTVPSCPATPKMVSYNRWMGHSPNPYLESSFTGQPITMYPPGAISPQVRKPPPGLGYTTPPVVDEGPRKWTEKKGKWRSRSTPRSTEIDEIIGSSKTKQANKLPAIFSPSSPQPIKRQSRVEIYESEKKLQKKGKFSLKKLFKIQGMEENNVDNKFIENVDNKFIDKEHEREILERQKMKARPEIIHPIDLLNGGVEVVKITPKNSLKGHYDKHKSGARSGEKPAVARQAELRAAKSDSDSKDSGHDTSSIHTETSEGTGSSSGGDTPDFCPALTPVGVVQQVGHTAQDQWNVE